MRFFLIVNPKAGPENPESALRAAAAALPERDLCQFYITAGPGDAASFVRQWLDRHPGEEARFVACGGDGTLNEVFNGAAGREGASVSCYPSGSGNDFVKSFGGEGRFRSLAALLRAPARRLDLLRVGARYSDNVVNFGFDTAVALSVEQDRARTGHGGRHAYIKGVAKALARHTRNEFTVTADGETLNQDGRALLCTVANGQYVGGTFRCAPRAETDDGWMEVCLVRPVSRLRFLRLVGAYARGEHLDLPQMRDMIVYRRAKRVEVSAPKGFAYSLDGEIVREEQFAIEIAPGAAWFAAPEE